MAFARSKVYIPLKKTYFNIEKDQPTSVTWSLLDLRAVSLFIRRQDEEQIALKKTSTTL